MSKIKHAPGVLCMTVNCILPSNNGHFLKILDYAGIRTIRNSLGELSDCHAWVCDKELVKWNGEKGFETNVYSQNELQPITGPSVDVTEHATVGDEVSA